MQRFQTDTESFWNTHTQKHTHSQTYAYTAGPRLWTHMHKQGKTVFFHIRVNLNAPEIPCLLNEVAHSTHLVSFWVVRTHFLSLYQQSVWQKDRQDKLWGTQTACKSVRDESFSDWQPGRCTAGKRTPWTVNILVEWQGITLKCRRTHWSRMTCGLHNGTEVNQLWMHLIRVGKTENLK